MGRQLIADISPREPNPYGDHRDSCGQHLPRPRDTAWPEQFSLIPDDDLPDYIASKNRKISERFAAPSEETTNEP